MHCICLCRSEHLAKHESSHDKQAFFFPFHKILHFWKLWNIYWHVYFVPLSENVTMVDTTEVDLNEVEKQLVHAERGGIIRPTWCKASSKVAIIIAFRDREQHLGVFLRHMHPFLHRQFIMARIFVIQMVSDRICTYKNRIEWNLRKLHTTNFPGTYWTHSS